MNVGGFRDNCWVGNFFQGFGSSRVGWGSDLAATPPQKLSIRTLGHAIEEALMSYTRADLEVVLADELKLEWELDSSPSDREHTKRGVIAGYMRGWGLAQMAALARRVVTECEVPDFQIDDLKRLLVTYDAGGGVAGPTKNLIFAASGPKPEIVLRDAVNNDIEIVKNAEYCLVYDEPVPAEGLRFSRLVAWWRGREQLSESVSDREVGRGMHQRLRASLDSDAERVLFDAYAARCRDSFDIPALVPQVYLHYDPYDQRTRRQSGDGSPLARQRMDFLLLFSDRRRVVIEVDGKQHYAVGDKANADLYAEMVAEDRRLRLSGYEVYRFGGVELFRPGSLKLLEDFFTELASRLS